MSVSLIWGRNGVFLFDSHSRNIEGFPYPNGSAVLLEFRLIRSLNNFIKKFYQVNVPNSFLLQYDIQYIKVNISTENISNIQTVLNRQRNSNYYYQSKKRNNDIDFEIECQCHSKKTKFQKCQQDEIEGNHIRTKQNEGYDQESFSNKSGKTKNSKTNENQLSMK